MNSEISSSSYFDNSIIGSDNCMLCDKKITENKFPTIIQTALSRKYCSNLNNYYFTKDIANIMENDRYYYKSI